MKQQILWDTDFRFFEIFRTLLAGAIECQVYYFTAFNVGRVLHHAATQRDESSGRKKGHLLVSDDPQPYTCTWLFVKLMKLYIIINEVGQSKFESFYNKMWS